MCLFRTKIEGGERRYNLSKVIVHPAYGKADPHDSDIALLKLERPAVFNTYISPVCLPTQDEKVAVDTKCYVTGTQLYLTTSCYNCTNNF